jgi:GT2 family glycosyltransferase
LNLSREGYEYALLLNADTVLEPDYLELLIDSLASIDRAGMATGKIFRMDEHGRRVKGVSGYILDSTGIYFTPTQRHFDRGSNEEDLGQYEQAEFVFGVSGAVLLCTREMLEDLQMGREYLDEDFFAYREDADLSWRAQLRGWRAVYNPSATARHCRTALPERRRELEPLINFHSVKNRYLMRAKNMDWAVWFKCFPYTWVRDCGIFAYLALREQDSLGAIAEVRRLRSKTSEKRRIIQGTRKVSGKEMARWFSFKPVSFEI